jgi:cation diffusion facilitator family transporter
MHKHDISKWKHSHEFNEEKKKAEARTLAVVLITITAMLIEIIAGWYFNSMALFADGWHMMTHAAALSISLAAYVLARRLSLDKRFTFGTWKIEILGAYTSAIVLGIVGFFVLFLSVERMFKPVAISYDWALIVAVIGLVVNITCAVILNGGKEQRHEHSHNKDHSHSRDYQRKKENNRDLNLRSAYIHVLMDALTSVLAIIALLGAKLYSWNFLDPLMGILGAILIFRWTYMLIRETSVILIGREMDERLVGLIVESLESDGDTSVSDIHIWRVAQNKHACVISLVATNPLAVEDYKQRLNDFNEIDHLTIEVNPCACDDVD